MTKRWRFLSCLLVVSAVLLVTIRLGWKDQAFGDNPGGDPRGPCPTFYCPTDLNNDGVVDGNDLALFPLSSCKDPSIPCPACCREDFDGDGEIACFDLTILQLSFGPCDGCGPGAGDCFVANGTPGTSGHRSRCS